MPGQEDPPGRKRKESSWLHSIFCLEIPWLVKLIVCDAKEVGHDRHTSTFLVTLPLPTLPLPHIHSPYAVATDRSQLCCNVLHVSQIFATL